VRVAPFFLRHPESGGRNGIQNTCPDFSRLSYFVDYELGKEEETQVERHLQGCPSCQAQVRGMERAAEMAHAEFVKPSVRLPMRVSAQQCLSPEIVSAYVQRLLSDEEKASANTHLRTCGVCLREVKDAFLISSSFVAKPQLVPAALTARVAAA